MGLFMSGIRQEILDGFLLKRMGISRPEIDESKLTDVEVLTALKFVSDSFYRYYQFYANMAVAITFTYIAWLIHDWHWSWWRLAGFVLLVLGLTVRQPGP